MQSVLLPKEHIANQAIRDAISLAEEVVKELREDIGSSVGMAELPRKSLRLAIRKAMSGDQEAMIRVIKLASEQSEHAVLEPCPVCAEIDYVMRESGNTMPAPANMPINSANMPAAIPSIGGNVA